MRPCTTLLLITAVACSGRGAHSQKGNTTGDEQQPPCCVQSTPEPFAWQLPTGPRSLGIASGLVVNGSQIVVAVYTGLLASTDEGMHWRPSTGEVAIAREGSVGRAGDVLLVLDHPDGTLSTTSDGDTFRQPFPTMQVTSLVSRGGEAWVSGRIEDQTPHLLHSSNGLSWDEVGQVARIVAPCDGFLVSDEVDNSLSISDNGGKDWTPVPAPSGFVLTPMLTCWGGSIFTLVAGDTWGIASSSDRGAHWRVIDAQLRLGWRAWYAPSADGLFLLTSLGEIRRLRTADGDWEIVQQPAELGSTLVDAAYGGPEGMYLASRGELYRFDPAQGKFGVIGDRPVRAFVNAMAADGETVWAVVDGREIHRSSDGGKTWDRVEGPLSESLTAIAAGGGQAFVGSTQDGLYRSDDGGKSWVDLSDVIPHYNGTAGDQPRDTNDLLLSSDGLYVATGGLEFLGSTEGNFQFTSAGVLFSPDGGKTFQAFTTGLPEVPNLPLGSEHGLASLGRLTEAGGTLFVQGVDGVHRSTDRGRTWEGPSRMMGLDAPVGDLLDVVASDSGLLGAFASDPTTSSGLLVSGDGGASWAPIETRPPGKNLVAGITRTGDRLAVLLVTGTTTPEANEGLWVSEDDGKDWSRWGEGSPPRNGQHLLATDHEVLVPTLGSGMARLPTDGAH